MLGTRLKVALVSGGLASLLGWWFLASREPAATGLRRVSADLEALLARREGTRSMVTGRGPFVLEPIDEGVARALFAMHKENFRWLPERYYGYLPGLRRVIEWDEHPAGRWVHRTNAAGLREDDDATFDTADLRILVTGDSHTDGICNNAESFTNRLEASLDARDPARRVVALNAGVVGYSFYNYLGVLESFADQDPDVFVVAIYGGNDFLEVLRPHHYFRGTQAPPTRPGYWDRIEAAKRVSSSATAQGLNQVLYFQEHPEQVEVVLEATRVLLRRIRERCEEEDVRLIVAYVPPAFELAWPELEEMQRRAEEVLDLAPSDFEVAALFSRQLFEELERLDIAHLDMGTRFRASGQLCYWKRDLHINLTGHRLLAEAIEEALDSGAGSLRPLQLEPPPDGPFEELGPDGAVRARGAYRDGLEDGEWTYFHEGGALRARGGWDAGVRTGEWQWWYEDGTPQKRGTYVDGQPDGTWHEWYRDGNERVLATWAHGIPNGPWRQWHPGGVPASVGAWKDGKMDGPWQLWYAGGALEHEFTYRDGELVGPAKRLHENGQPAWTGVFAGGARHGFFTYWDADGNRKSEGAFTDGEREGPTHFWREDGSLDEARSGIYRGGTRVSPLPDETAVQKTDN